MTRQSESLQWPWHMLGPLSFVRVGFFSVERVWRSICAVRNVSDFKTVTSYRLVGKDQYEIVAPGGELKQGTLGEETYTNKADTRGGAA